MNVVRTLIDLPARDGTVYRPDLSLLEALINERGGDEVANRPENWDSIPLHTLAAFAGELTIHDPVAWPLLAGRIEATLLQGECPDRFSESVSRGASEGVALDPMFIALVFAHNEEIDAAIRPERDMNFDAFALGTMQRSLRRSIRGKNTGQRLETPQYGYMRVALALCAVATFREHSTGAAGDQDMVAAAVERAIAYYELLSTQRISHASPTLLNAGTAKPQLSSCFLLPCADNLHAMLKDAISDAGIISSRAGGISVALSSVRCAGSTIHGSGGKSLGIIPMMRQLNLLLEWINQGGLRKGAIAAYLEPWHPDVFDFLEMGRKQGKLAAAGKNAPDLKLALWVPDNFMRALRDGGDWYLMDPSRDACPGLDECHGMEYEKLYDSYVAAGKYTRKIKASDIFEAMVHTINESGVPYVLFKDAINRKSNAQNVGTIRSSNLCAEIAIPSWIGNKKLPKDDPRRESEYGVCTIGALCLEQFVVEPEDNGDGYALPATEEPDPPTIDWAALHAAAAAMATALDVAIEVNDYPTPACRRSSLRHRPIGVGIMGLQDVFHRLRVAYGSQRARDLDEAIMATIYHGAATASVERAKTHGAYETFPGSPASKGALQPDMWAEERAGETGKMGSIARVHTWLPPSDVQHEMMTWEDRVSRTTGGILHGMDWSSLRANIVSFGLRNSQLTACMPTASTGHVAGQNECFEPNTYQLYTRKVLGGEYIVGNRHLVRELGQLYVEGKTDRPWDATFSRALMANDSRLEGLDLQELLGCTADSAKDLKRRYKTSRELDQRLLVMHSAARAPFVDHTQSLNYYFDGIDGKRLSTVLFAAWTAGLKTGMYYAHSQPASGGQQTSVRGAQLAAGAAPVAVNANTGCDSGACAL